MNKVLQQSNNCKKNIKITLVDYSKPQPFTKIYESNVNEGSVFDVNGIVSRLLKNNINTNDYIYDYILYVTNGQQQNYIGHNTKWIVDNDVEFKVSFIKNKKSC